MKEIRRKLGRQDGVTLVFALVIFLIMALFSYVMVNASLTAAQGAAMSQQVNEKAYLSVRPIATLIQKSLEANPTMTYTSGAPSPWKDDNADKVVKEIFLKTLNDISTNSRSFTWSVDTGDSELNNAFQDVTFTVTVEQSNEDDLKAAVADSSKGPIFMIKFDSDYKMTMIIRAFHVRRVSDIDYEIEFNDTNGKLNAETTLGVS